MGFSDIGLFVKIGFLTAVLGTIIFMVGMATRKWQEADLGVAKYYNGLWRKCVETSAQTTCEETDSDKDWSKACIGFIIMTVIACVAGIASLILYFIKSDLKVLHIVSIITIFVAGLFAIIGVGLYAANYDEDVPAVVKENLNLAWSIWLTLVGGIILIIASVFVAIDKFISK